MSAYSDFNRKFTDNSNSSIRPGQSAITGPQDHATRFTNSGGLIPRHSALLESIDADGSIIQQVNANTFNPSRMYVNDSLRCYDSNSVPAYRPTKSHLHEKAHELVIETTVSGITDREAEKKRLLLTNFILQELGGEPVAIAFRKRLSNDDSIIVLSTLSLLDEIVRTCPYFYRYIANNKFFTKLWQFVNPNYKKIVPKKPTKPKVLPGLSVAMDEEDANKRKMRESTLIYIRAWAEELSRMFRGVFEPAAAFWVQRYVDKSRQVQFPPVPKSSMPWVCPIQGTSNIKQFDVVQLEDHRQVVLRLNEMILGSNPAQLENQDVQDQVSKCRDILQVLSVKLRTYPDHPQAKEMSDLCDRIEQSLRRYESNRLDPHIVGQSIVPSSAAKTKINSYEDWLKSKNLPLPTSDGPKRVKKSSKANVKSHYISDSDSDSDSDSSSSNDKGGFKGSKLKAPYPDQPTHYNMTATSVNYTAAQSPYHSTQSSSMHYPNPGYVGNIDMNQLNLSQYLSNLSLPYANQINSQSPRNSNRTQSPIKHTMQQNASRSPQ